METRDILKFIVILASLPWVVPFVKSLVRDLLHAFDEDGGLLGPPPSPDELAKIVARKRLEPNPLVSEPLAHVKAAVEAGERIPGQTVSGTDGFR